MKKLFITSLLALSFISCEKEDNQVTCNCVYKKEFKHVTTYPNGNVTNTGWQTYGQTREANCESQEIVEYTSVEYPNLENSVTVSEYRWKLYCE